MALLRPALVVFILLSIITGVLYPLAITGAARAVFPLQAGGSLIIRDSRPVGSRLIGQEFSGAPGYFWGRLSATAPVGYTAFNAETSTGSSGSNFGPTNPALLDAVRGRVEALHAADAAVGFRRPQGQRVPVDLVTASGSGVDPHISIAAAEYQAPRVARARRLSAERVNALVRAHTRGRQLAFLGEPVVNVLELNLALDAACR
jgi:K+-transporting ATPase ATPase C chain